MRDQVFRIIASVALLFISAPLTLQAQQRPNEPLTNASVVKLVRAGFKDKTIIAIVRSRPNRFDLDPDRLIELKHKGVNENIILAMMAQDDSAFIASDDWSEDSFFRAPNKESGGKSSDNQAGSSTDIFGSSGGSKGQTRSGGMNGSSGGDTLTTGSATVRIIRPPVEEGGSSVKLEKTPTLTNDSIIRLVEAGFSEGTIIKRIEDSPADFDVSPDKLIELRKHRVTDAIIASMTAAMSDDSSSKTTAPGGTREN